MKISAYKWWLVVAVVTLALTITGCGGKDESSSASTSTGTTGSTATVTEEKAEPTQAVEATTPDFESQEILNLSDLPDPANLDEIQVGVIEYDASKGPIVDRVIFDARTDETIALKDTATGKTDMFASSLQAAVFKNLPEADQAALETYVVPELSWSLLLNPIPNEAPYTWTTDDNTTYFNPFAMQEVRYALNWLIDRKKIIDEIAYGEGEPMFVPQTPGQPGTYQYNLIAAKLGMTATGDEAYAIKMISDAMDVAAALPENQGKLVKKNGFWTYDGADVTIKFLIRVDDPTGRLLAGHYISDQIEKAGIKVERLEWDRSRCSNAVYGGDPANFEWQMYTEGWGAGATRKWWDVTISQMYAPYYGYMPGGAMEGNWNYANAEMDRLAQKSYYGKFLTAEEYWEDNLTATELGLTESVRIYLNSLNAYFVVNDERTLNRMLYGYGDGLANKMAIGSVDIPANADGEKVFRVTQFTAQGSLFMDVWDILGIGGFSSTYSSTIFNILTHRWSVEAPNSGTDTEVMSTWYDVTTDVDYNADGELVGYIEVPANALEYDPVTDTWVEVGEGVTAYSKGTGKYKYSRWHHGVEATLADNLYAKAFYTEWSSKDDENDLEYEQSFAATWSNKVGIDKGFIINDDGSITSYGDYNWPMDKARVGAEVAGVMAQAAGPSRPLTFPWDLYEATALLVTEGNTEGERYTIAEDASLKQIDIKMPDTIADIRAKYVEMYNRGHVPASIKDYVTVEEAKERYAHGIKFIDTYGHAYISNGAFFLSKLDTANNFAEATAFRDASYPFEKGYWNELLATDMTRIDFVDMPASAKRSNGLTFTAYVSQFTYPSSDAVDASADVKVKALVIDPDGKESEFAGTYSGYGEFIFDFSSSDLAALGAGRYTVVIMSSLADEAPSTSTHTITLN